MRRTKRCNDEETCYSKMAAPGMIAVSAMSLVMFIASFGTGTVQLAMSLNHKRMSLISSLGVGLLVGTSLGVVLPEGIEMLYTSIPLATRHELLRRQEHNIPEITANQRQTHGYASFDFAIPLALVLGYLVMHLLTFLPPL